MKGVDSEMHEDASDSWSFHAFSLNMLSFLFFLPHCSQSFLCLGAGQRGVRPQQHLDNYGPMGMDHWGTSGPRISC